MVEYVILETCVDPYKLANMHIHPKDVMVIPCV